MLTALLSAQPAAEERFDEGRLEKEVLAAGLHDVIQLSVASNGDVYFVERAGAVKRYAPQEKAARSIGTVPTIVGGEYGLIGLALAPDFARTRQLFVTYAPRSDGGKRIRVSRFTLNADGGWDAGSEKVVLTYAIDGSGHQGGSLQFDDAGNLWISVGDDANANVTPETDERPGRETFNALRTSANTQDLRGKILRIRPQPDGTYTIPAGNLFADPSQGRPEIYIMGCRNPYRFHFDGKSGELFWGDVGSNTEERFGTGGYDEFTRTTRPGNGGWPQFIGPNTAYRRFTHGANVLGEPYDPARPLNESRLNTGLRELPPPIPALIWYGSEDSREFPELGNGGRSALAGPVYRYDPQLASPVKLPARFDGRFFIADWARTWIKTVAFAEDRSVSAIEPFLGRMIFNRPIELKFGPDGALYLLEFGTKWGGNTDGVLSRIVYRRGNRPPVAIARADVQAGLAPLKVRFSARDARDPDGDALTYTWQFGEGGATAEGREVEWTYTGRGVRTVALVVTDAQGLSDRTAIPISVGNAPPVVRVAAPVHGSFVDWKQKVPFAIEVTDGEDGSTAKGTIAAADVQVLWQYRDELTTQDGVPPQVGFEGGAALMRKSDCLSCHQLATPSVGPSFFGIADRYRGDAEAAARLQARIRDGGAGSWGDVPMPPHPQHGPAELAEMVDYILTLQPPSRGETIQGLAGELATRDGPRNAMHEKNAGGSYLLTVRYRDRGAAEVPALTTEARAVLHARRRRAALFDASAGVTIMEVSTLRRDRRICAQLREGSHLKFADVNLAGIARIACEVSAGAGHGGTIEFRVGRPDGPVVGRVEVPATGQWEKWQTVSANVRDPGGVHDFYVVAGAAPSGASGRFNVDVLEFVRGDAAPPSALTPAP